MVAVTIHPNKGNCSFKEFFSPVLLKTLKVGNTHEDNEYDVLVLPLIMDCRCQALCV